MYRAHLLIVGLAVLELAGCGSAKPQSPRANLQGSGTHPSGSGQAPSASVSPDAVTGVPLARRYLSDQDNPSVGRPEITKANESGYYHDKDDGATTAIGSPPSAAQSQAVTSTVQRYYEIATAEHGAEGCAMLTPTLAKQVPEVYGVEGPTYVPPATRTCAAVLHLVFKLHHAQLTAGVGVTSVRLVGNQAYAFLGSSAAAASYIVLQREGNAWRLTQLLGTENGLP
jgi:hypothetical protein